MTVIGSLSLLPCLWLNRFVFWRLMIGWLVCQFWKLLSILDDLCNLSLNTLVHVLQFKIYEVFIPGLIS